MTHRTSASQRARERPRSIRCDVSRCYQPVHGLSRYCRHHDRVNQDTGHPEGRTIRAGELRPFRKLCAAFIDRHHYHEGIEHALEWIGQRIAEAKDPRYLTVKSTAEQRLARWFARMNREGVDPSAVLATVAALYLYRLYRPQEFRSDRHWRHQLAVRTLRLVPAPRAEHWAGSGGVRCVYDRITVATRDHLSQRLVTALGLLAFRIAREVLADLDKPSPDKLSGADAPFTINHDN
jgi:hypothetical protein